MKKYAKLENSGITDGIHGKAIFVSTTARLSFRQVNPSYMKVRNQQLNYVIGSLFAQSEPIDYFRPKKNGEEAVGEVREGSGAKFISIVYPSHVSVLAVKQVPQIPAPVEEIPLTSSTKQIMTKRAKHNEFFMQHLLDLVAVKHGITSEDTKAILTYLKQFDDSEEKTIARDLLKGNNETINKLLSTIQQKELSTKPHYDSLEPRDTFSISEGLSI